jgi:hypothetical protein
MSIFSSLGQVVNWGVHAQILLGVLQRRISRRMIWFCESGLGFVDSCSSLYVFAIAYTCCIITAEE